MLPQHILGPSLSSVPDWFWPCTGRSSDKLFTQSVSQLASQPVVFL